LGNRHRKALYVKFVVLYRIRILSFSQFEVGSNVVKNDWAIGDVWVAERRSRLTSDTAIRPNGKV
jgi:hypothetical protein